MMINKNILLFAAAVAAVVSGLWGCDSSNDPLLSTPSSDVYHAGFTITLSQPSVTTSRATPPGDYDPGNTFENHIDLDNGDYRILFFDKDDKYVGTFDKANVVVKDETDVSKTYFIMGQLDPGLVVDNTLSVKIMMLANWGEYPEPVVNETKLSDIANDATNVFDFDTSDDAGKTNTIVDADRPIPMAGVSNFKADLEFDEQHYLNFGTIHMLRAYAKVEVFNTEASVLTLESVTMTRVNTKGYGLSKNVSKESDYKKDDYNEDYTLAPSIPTVSQQVENIPFVKTSTGSYLIYVPEFANLADNGDPLHSSVQTHISLKFKESPVTFPIYFCTYSEGKPTYSYFNLMRNYWYRYNITKNYDDLKVVVTLVPYIGITLKPGFGFDDILPGDHNPPTGWYD